MLLQLKSADSPSTLATNILLQLQHTDFSFISFEIKIPQKYPLSSVFEINPKNYHELFASKNINSVKKNILKYQNTDLFLKNPGASLIDPLGQKFENKNPTSTGSKALILFFDRFELLQVDEDSDLLYLTNYCEFKKHAVGKTQICFSLKLLFTAFHRAHWHGFSGHYGLDETNINFELSFCLPGLPKWLDLLNRNRISCETKASRMDVDTAP